jgi:hypothetical protein
MLPQISTNISRALEICSQALLNNRIMCNTDTDFLKSVFVLLVSGNVKMHCNICWWSPFDSLCDSLFWRLGMLDLVKGISPLHCSSLLSQSDWLHCQEVTWFSDFFSLYASDLQVILQKLLGHPYFLSENQPTGGYPVPFPSSFNARRRAALLMTKGFKFSPMSLQQKRKRKFPVVFSHLYMFFCLNEAFPRLLSIKQPRLLCIKVIWLWVFIYYMVQFWFPVFNGCHIYSCQFTRQ